MTNQVIKISENCWKHTYKNGDICYTKTSDPKSEYHREDGPSIELENGSKAWHIDGKRHREDGPAVELSSGTKEWHMNGKCHREDGPAVELSNGGKEWHYQGKYIDVKSQKEFEIYIKNLIFI